MRHCEYLLNEYYLVSVLLFEALMNIGFQFPFFQQLPRPGNGAFTFSSGKMTEHPLIDRGEPAAVWERQISGGVMRFPHVAGCNYNLRGWSSNF